MNTKRLPLLLAVLGTLLGNCSVQAGQPITPVAVTGQLPPDIGPNTEFLLFQHGIATVALSDLGQVAFISQLEGSGINSSNNRAIFSGAAGALQLVARKGSPAPALPGRIFTGDFAQLGMNQYGELLFGNNLDDGNYPFFTGLPGTLDVLAKEGDLIPGAPGPVLDLRPAGLAFNNSIEPINDLGHAAVGARFVGGSAEVSIVVGAPGSLLIAAQPGMQAPGLPPGVTFTSPLEGTVWLQSQDRMLFQSTLDSPTDSFGVGLFTGMPGALSLVARDGDPADGTSAGVFYIIDGAYTGLSASEIIAFGTFLTGQGVNSLNSDGLWVGAPGGLQLVARGDMQAPGVPAGVKYGITPYLGFTVGFAPVINSSGSIAYTQYLNTGQHGIWSRLADALRLVAIQGQTAPGLAPGETLGGAGNSNGLTFASVFYINDAGRVAFSARVGTRDFNNDFAIFVSNPDGELVYVTRFGDSVALDDGRTLTVASFPILGGFNSKGQILIHANLSNGSDAILLADTAATVITSASTASGKVGTSFTFQLTASNSPTSFNPSNNLPPGLSLNNSTGVISGTPTDTGTFPVSVSATNEVGPGPTSTLTITITSAPTPTPTPSPTPTPTPSPSPSASPSPSPSVSPSPSASPSPSPSASPSPTPFFPVQLANISTRLSVGTADNVLIGGFIVAGMQAKAVIVRAIGPSLPLGGVLSDPVLEIHDSTGAIIATNDNWQESANKQAIIDAGFAPSNDNESAILMTLTPGPYTAIVQGVGGTTGVALVEVYDLDRTVDSKLANISTRGFVQTSDNVMIGGIIILGDTDTDVLVRAIGPALTPFGVTGVLEDPTLELHDKDGAIIASNDDWKVTQQTAIEATGLAPSDDRESAILATLTPDSYTAIVRGKDDTTGVALVEVYNISLP